MNFCLTQASKCPLCSETGGYGWLDQVWKQSWNRSHMTMGWGGKGSQRCTESILKTSSNKKQYMRSWGWGRGGAQDWEMTSYVEFKPSWSLSTHIYPLRVKPPHLWTWEISPDTSSLGSLCFSFVVLLVFVIIYSFCKHHISTVSFTRP